MDPGEERLIAGSAPEIHALAASTTAPPRALRLELHRRIEPVELRVELVESLREAVLAAENECADEAARTVSGGLQKLGERGRLFGHRRRRVVADGVPGWIDAGQDRRVRRTRQRRAASSHPRSGHPRARDDPARASQPR